MSCKVSTAYAVASADDEGAFSDLAEKLVYGNCGEMTVVSVNFSVIKAIIEVGVVRQVNIDGHCVDTLSLLNSEGLLRVLSSSEVGWLVHVNPDTRKFDLIVESFHLYFPEGVGIGMQKINKMYSAWPHLCLIILTRIFWILKEYIHAFSHVHSVLIVDGDSCVQQRNKMYLMLFHHFVEFITMGVGVDCEYHLFVHVVKV